MGKKCRYADIAISAIYLNIGQNRQEVTHIKYIILSWDDWYVTFNTYMEHFYEIWDNRMHQLIAIGVFLATFDTYFEHQDGY